MTETTEPCLPRWTLKAQRKSNSTILQFRATTQLRTLQCLPRQDERGVMEDLFMIAMTGAPLVLYTQLGVSRHCHSCTFTRVASKRKPHDPDNMYREGLFVVSTSSSTLTVLERQQMMSLLYTQALRVRTSFGRFALSLFRRHQYHGL